MKPEPLWLIIARLKKLPLYMQIAELRTMVKSEPLHSVRHNELSSLLEGCVSRQLKREIRESRA